MVALVKPLFEYLDYCQPKDFQGIVTSADDVFAVVSGLLQDLHKSLPEWHLHNICESPIHGAKGNREFLIHLSRNSSKLMNDDNWETVVHSLIFKDS